MLGSVAGIPLVLIIFLLGSAFAQALQWTEIHTDTAPPARRSHAMVYDPDNRVVIMFGGYSNGTHIGDTWVFDVQSHKWKKMQPENSPSPRAATTLVYDPDNKDVILFGGFAHGHDVVFNDTWSYNYKTDTWSDLKAANPPDQRASYGSAYDSKRHNILLFGGFTELGYFNDVWTYSPKDNSWTKVTTSGDLPDPRGAMGFVYDSKNDVFIMFGGFSDGGWFNDTWIFNPNTNEWKKMNPQSSPPPVRTRMIYDESIGRSIFFGGDVADVSDEEARPIPYSETWSYDFMTNKWERLELAGKPAARALNGIAFDQSSQSIIVFGGTDSLIDNQNFVGHEMNDMWVLDLKGENPANDNDASSTITSNMIMPIGIGAGVAAIIVAAVYFTKRNKRSSSQ